MPPCIQSINAMSILVYFWVLPCEVIPQREGVLWSQIIPWAVKNVRKKPPPPLSNICNFFLIWGKGRQPPGRPQGAPEMRILGVGT